MDGNQVKPDILYLVHNRREFTEASLAALRDNTDWSRVGRLWIYSDVGASGEDDGAADLAESFPIEGVARHLTRGFFGGPVNVMRHHLMRIDIEISPVFCKIDSDVIVPPGWFGLGVDTMEASAELSFLGIEPPASRTKAPWSSIIPPVPERMASAWRFHRKDDGGSTTAEHYPLEGEAVELMEPSKWVGYARCDSIGGVGFMRAAAFDLEAMRQHSTYGGFTDWQLKRPGLMKGWILPPLKLFLLDRLPYEPWASLSREYIARKWQRPWTNYCPSFESELWGWWGK
jgi:hypothetical protein